MKTANEARLATDKYVKRATDEQTKRCIESAEANIDKAIGLGYYECPINMWTQESLMYFKELGYTFETRADILMIKW